MMGEQEAFQKQLDKLERVINGFGKYTDLGKVKARARGLLWLLMRQVRVRVRVRVS